MKFNAKKLLSSVLALAMTVSMLPGLNAFATENTTATEETDSVVKIGAEVLLESAEWKEYLKGKNVALFTNQVCVDADMNHLADKLYADPDINLVCMFGGEHGLRGAYQAGASVPHQIDATTGLINWSLYNGGTIDTEALGLSAIKSVEGCTDELNPKNPSRPTRVMLSGNQGEWYEPIDVILFDLQEIGSKTWTYITNLADMMGACVEAETYYNQSVELIVLDRPSPISSDVVEGTVADFNNSTGYGRIYLPSRYGMTMGELALMINGEDYCYYWTTSYPGGPENLYGVTTKASSGNSKGYWPFQTDLEEGDTEAIITAKNWVKETYKDKLSLGSCKVSVIPCEGYTRDMYWDETGLQFILPSPNMPTAEACLVYAGTVWTENLVVNEGRGTTLPFSIISAPYIDSEAFAERLNSLGLEGVIFRPCSTTTMIRNQLYYASVDYTDVLAHGVQIHVTDKRAYSTTKVGLAILLSLQAMYGVNKGDANEATLKADGEHFYAKTWNLDYTMGKDWGTSEIYGFAVGSSAEDTIAKIEELYERTEEELEPFLEIRENYLMDEYNVPEDKELVNTLEPQVTLGYEAFLENAAYTKDLKIGLVTNQSGVTTDLQHLADVFAADSNVNLTTLFSTGYGLRGEFQTAEDGEYTDEKTGLTVYRLNENAPTADQLKNVDMLVFDIQDTGARSSSVAELMASCIKACAESNKTFAVLDRPNPVGGESVEGPVDSTYGIPSRYGMTAGELAIYLANEQGVSNVKVYEMKGYDRDMFYDETGLQFIQTDLKIGNNESQTGYTALSWLEGTSFNYGWGTTKTYLFFGAPFVKEQMVDFANALNELELPGVRFRLAAMTPWANTTEEAGIIYAGEACYGVQMHIMDEHEFNAIETVVNILVTAQKFFGDDLTFNEKFTEIVGNEAIATAIKAGKSADEIIATFESDLTAFNTKREAALIYGVEKTVSAADYTDVAADASYFKAVDYMVSNGYMNGTSDTTFAPESELTRAQVVTILYRIAGEPSVKGLEVNFSDVEDSWYTAAVKWAVSEGIVTGHEDGTFRPNDAMTRDQMIAVLYRYAKKPTADSSALNGITDTATIPEYATSAMAWAVANGIISADNNALNAMSSASRAQTAVSFFSYLSK